MKVLEISHNQASVDNTNELFGLEIEVENVVIPDVAGTMWDVVGDGSLRNNGQEFRSRPMSYDDAIANINTFYAWHQRHGYQTNIRTSTHVHCNVLGFELAEVNAALTAYALVEPLLFRVCGREREENIYCVPWYRGPDETTTVRGFADDSYRTMNACKYSALYVEPVTRYGTVEFRQAPVFDDAASCIFWLNLCRAVVYNGRKFITGENTLEQYEKIGSQEFVRNLFGYGNAVRLQGYCETTFENIIDEQDSVHIAELCVPSRCTYKVTEDWSAPLLAVEGDMQEGYHRIAPATPRGRYNLDAYNPDYEPEEEMWYDEEDE